MAQASAAVAVERFCNDGVKPRAVAVSGDAAYYLVGARVDVGEGEHEQTKCAVLRYDMATNNAVAVWLLHNEHPEHIAINPQNPRDALVRCEKKRLLLGQG